MEPSKIWTGRNKTLNILVQLKLFNLGYSWVGEKKLKFSDRAYYIAVNSGLDLTFRGGEIFGAMEDFEEEDGRTQIQGEDFVEDSELDWKQICKQN